MEQEERLYFAYGSNINLKQMQYRCPNAIVVGPVVLEGYELLFRGNSRNDGVATIRPKEGSQVHGLLWSITPECERSLDRYEGFPFLYEKQDVTVRDQNGAEAQVMAYVMTHERQRLPSIPSAVYYNGIEDGFRQNGLPLEPLRDALDQVFLEVEQHKRQQKKNRRYER
jgi:gamma-glutamylcyclotransferase (GGCT)/AIG2-like uncharacterized protein YtfP